MQVLYNQAYTYAKLGEIDWCTKLLNDAQKCKQEEKHNIIDTAIDNFKVRFIHVNSIQSQVGSGIRACLIEIVHVFQ